jgi:hypothetical protein
MWEKMLCPLIKSDCVTTKCAWYDNGNKCCAILGMVIERIKATEAVEGAATVRTAANVTVTPNVTVNPIVQVKEILKTITVPIEGKNVNEQPSSPSTNTPTVTW